MIKKVLLAGLLTLVLGMPSMKAQDAYLSENNTNDAILIQAGQSATLSTANRTPNKFAVAPQLAYNGNKLGAGLRLSYDFTDALRFTIDGDYYFYTAKGGYEGRVMDLNPNLNFVFGNSDFHFYLITGIYFSIGQSMLLDNLTDLSGDEDPTTLGLGFNVGCGIEYQITENIRAFFEQQACLGLMSSWMPKLGCAFCF
jgi:opacity protein-like surface antigen